MTSNFCYPSGNGLSFFCKIDCAYQKKYLFPKAHLKISVIMIAFIINAFKCRKSYQFFSQYIFQ